MNSQLLVKVCGMRDADNIREVENLFTLHSSFLAFWMGFIFYPKSSRYVSERPAYLPQKCKRVGVFVDATIDDILKRIADYGLDMIQLHGHESPDFISQFKYGAVAPRPCKGGVGGGVSIIKAFNIATKEDLDATAPYAGLVDYFLFDTKGPSVGGNGEKFDWDVLTAYNGNTPFLLSGGIGPDDAERIRLFHHPKCIGLDLNSRFESAPALKDVTTLSRFLDEIE